MAVDTNSQENIQITNEYRLLLKSCRYVVSTEEKKLIRKAFNFALNAHGDIRRKSGELYIFHPLAVAQIVSKEIGLGATAIICSLLHDVVEDTDIQLEEIEGIFGKKVAKIIDGLTKISGFIGHTPSMQAENFRKILLTMAEDLQVILIKIADRLHNLRTLDAVPKQTQLKIASETIELFAPLANRLGLFNIKSEMEDLVLKYTEPQIYQEIDSKINAYNIQLGKYVKTLMKPVTEVLKLSNIQYEYKARFKSRYSIYKKMKSRNIVFDQVYDLFAIRIIVLNSLDEKADCWHVYSIITDFYKPNSDRLRDWLSTPKINGYESLHTTVMGPAGRWVEIQVRSKRMDEIAEKGYAAHWRYKEQNNLFDSTLDEWIKQVGDMLTSQEGSAIEFFDEFKMNLFSREVYIFTPKGDLKVLPSKSTVLDFAFHIHTDIGLYCIGAKVNNKLASLNYVLQNGDQVEILTSKKVQVKVEWEKFVNTAKAISKIKQALKEERKVIVNKGMQILNKKLEIFNKDVNAVASRFIDYFQVGSYEELLFRLGNNAIDHADLNNAFKVLKIEVNSSDKVKENNLKKGDILLVGGESDVDYSFAKCCNPIPGDDIFGFLAVGEGIIIHRTNCPTGIKLMSSYGFRIVEASWRLSPAEKKEYFSVGISFRGLDNVGMLSSITDIISRQFEINMKSISANSIAGAFEGKIVVSIFDTHHLDSLIEKLKMIDGMDSVNRFHVDERVN